MVEELEEMPAPTRHRDRDAAADDPRDTRRARAARRLELEVAVAARVRALWWRPTAREVDDRLARERRRVGQKREVQLVAGRASVDAVRGHGHPPDSGSPRRA